MRVRESRTSRPLWSLRSKSSGRTGPKLPLRPIEERRLNLVNSGVPHDHRNSSEYPSAPACRRRPTGGWRTALPHRAQPKLRPTRNFATHCPGRDVSRRSEYTGLARRSCIADNTVLLDVLKFPGPYGGCFAHSVKVG